MLVLPWDEKVDDEQHRHVPNDKKSASDEISETKPMTSIAADELLPAERIRRAVLAGDVTQLHRGDKHASVGDRFEIDDVAFEVTAVREERLGDLTDEDAQAEGSPNLNAYKERIERTHDVTWDDEDTVVLHRFERVESE